MGTFERIPMDKIKNGERKDLTEEIVRIDEIWEKAESIISQKGANLAPLSKEGTR